MELVDGDTFEFGIMAKDELRSHVFRIRNAGDAPLELSFESMTCQCTSIVLDGRTMPRQERWVTTVGSRQTREITLTWQPAKYDLEFSQTATFLTNDPSRPELQLTVKGRVQQIWRYDPLAIDFGSVPRDKAQQRSVDVYGYRDADFAVSKVELLDEGQQQFFALQIEPMPDEKIKSEPGALGGSVVTVSLKPGLPFGKALGHIRIHTNKPDLEPLVLRVEANVVSDIQIVSSIFRSEEGLLLLGALPGDGPSEFKFWFLIKGPYAATTEISLASTDPAEVLSVRLDEPQRTGQLSKIQATLTITPTDNFVNRTGSKQAEFGKLVFKTTHPDVEEMVIPVSFRVEGRKQ
jgi:hypothetical protein